MIDLTQLDKFTVGMAQQTVPGDLRGRVITPDNKLSEGIDSVQRHLPAPFLPLVRYDEEFRTHVVISSQTPVAFANMKDGTQFLVPAGYAVAMAEADTEIVYTAEDVQQGVKNPEGKEVKAGDSVIASMTAAGVKVSAFCGIVNYNVFRHMGGDGVNPYQYNYRNFNPQPNVSYNMDYAFEYPMVKNEDEYKKAPLKGISAFIGDKALAGQFITYDKHSHFVLTEQDGFGYGSIKPEHIVGQVSKVTVFKDPTTGETKNTFNHLDKVVNIALLGQDTKGTNNIPGHNSDGLITKLTYSNGFGLISFSIQTR